MSETTVVNVRRDQFDVYIGRWNPRFPKEPSYKWGNPFKPTATTTLEEVLSKYEAHIRSSLDLMAAIHELKGKRLGCWCVEKPINYVRTNKVCHGEVLLKLIEEVCL